LTLKFLIWSARALSTGQIKPEEGTGKNLQGRNYHYAQCIDGENEAYLNYATFPVIQKVTKLESNPGLPRLYANAWCYIDFQQPTFIKIMPDISRQCSVTGSESQKFL
jgi:hypothetical protein